MNNQIYTIATKVLSPYIRNKNTGNKYEIAAILHVLRVMGLEQAPFDFEMAGAAGRGFVIDGHTITGLQNVTQDDGVGKTGDLMLVSATGAAFSLSICGGKPSRNGSVSKCLTNPSARRLGATDEDIALYNAIANEQMRAYIAHFQQTYGNDESKWPTRVRTPFAITAASRVATATAARFATFDPAKQIAIFRDLLRIDDVSVKPADYLALVHEKTLVPRFYAFGAPKMADWAPRIEADGIWLHLYNGDAKIGSIQVKFNNGIYHRGKTSSLCTSWNFTVDLSSVFSLTQL